MPIALNRARIIPPDPNFKPPAMPPGDLALWQLWIPHAAKHIMTLWADVPLADTPPPPDTAPNIDLYWWRTNALRADLIAHTVTGNWWIIELHAGDPTEALGHLITYRAQWLADPPTPNAQPTAILVTDTHRPEFTRAAALANITYWHITPTTHTTPHT